MTDETIKYKMQTLIYHLTKRAASHSFISFLKEIDITEEEYRQIKTLWKQEFGITPYV